MRSVLEPPNRMIRNTYVYRKTFSTFHSPHRRHRQRHQQHKSQYIYITFIIYRIASFPILSFSAIYIYLCTLWKSQKIILFIIHQCLISFLFCYSLCSNLHTFRTFSPPPPQHPLYPSLDSLCHTQPLPPPSTQSHRIFISFYFFVYEMYSSDPIRYDKSIEFIKIRRIRRRNRNIENISYPMLYISSMRANCRNEVRRLKFLCIDIIILIIPRARHFYIILIYDKDIRNPNVAGAETLRTLCSHRGSSCTCKGS